MRVGNCDQLCRGFQLAFMDIHENESGDNNNDIDSIINIEPEDIEGIIDAESIERYCFEKILNGDRMGQIILNEMLEGKTQKQI